MSDQVQPKNTHGLGRLAQRFYDDRRLIVLTLLLAAAAGISSLLVLPRMEDPLLTQRAATITTIYPGADAQRVEALVTEKLEDNLVDIPEIKRMRSRSSAGSSFISIELRDEVYDPEPIWSEIRGKVEDSISLLPTGASRPEFNDLEIAAYAWIGAVVWERDEEPAWAVIRRLARDLKDRLIIRGTRAVDLFGDPGEEILVEIDSNRAEASGLSAVAVARQLAVRDVKTSAGVLRGEDSEVVIELQNQFHNMADIQEATISSSANSVLKLSDLASIRRTTPEPPATKAIIDGKPGVVVGVLLRPEFRIDQWAKEAQQVVDEFRAELPPGLQLKIVMEQQEYVADRMGSLVRNLLLGISAVAFVTLVFMGWRSSLLVTATLPVASLMVFSGMRFLDIPIHQMSVTGLIIALGLMIDNAIIATDEIQLSLKRGLKPRDAVYDLVRRLFAPLLASTTTTALAFAPIALMVGPAGEFVGAIAITVMLAISSSLFLAMTVLPAAAALLQRGLYNEDSQAASVRDRETPRRFMGRPLSRLASACGETVHTCWQHGITIPWITQAYRWMLRHMLRRPLLGVAAGCLLPVLGFWSATQLNEQFFPPADRDQVYVELELDPAASLQQTEEVARRVGRELEQCQRVQHVSWFLGESAPSFYYNIISRRKNAPNYGQAIVTLDSSENVTALIRRLQSEFDDAFPSARVLVRQLEQGPPFDAPVEVRLLGPNLERLQELGEQVRSITTALPEVLHARTSLSEVRPVLEVDVDASQVSWIGLSEAEVAEQLFARFEGLRAGTIIEEVEEIPVRVRIEEQVRRNYEDVANSTILVSRDRGTTPLRSFATVELQPQNSVVERYNGRRNNEVQTFITAGVLPSRVLGSLQAELAKQNFAERLPSGYSIEFGGEASERDAAVGRLMAFVPVLAVAMVAGLVLALASFRLTGLIGLVATLSIGLGMGALWIFGYPFGFMAIVGTMGLIGIAINDSIVVVAALKEDERVLNGELEATVETIVDVTRHVLATTATTVFGFMPLLLSGGGFWPPLAVAIGTGVVGATLISVTLVPCMFRLMAGAKAG